LNVVRLGEYDLTVTHNNARDFAVEKTIKHPNYVKYKVNDIALVKLRGKVQFTKDIRPLCLNVDPRSFVNQYVVVTGFGSTGFLEDSSEFLLKVKLKIKSNIECATDYPITNSQLCIQGERVNKTDLFHDSCQGFLVK
jgi:hypothetical protein